MKSDIVKALREGLTFGALLIACLVGLQATWVLKQTSVSMESGMKTATIAANQTYVTMLAAHRYFTRPFSPGAAPPTGYFPAQFQLEPEEIPEQDIIRFRVKSISYALSEDLLRWTLETGEVQSSGEIKTVFEEGYTLNLATGDVVRKGKFGGANARTLLVANRILYELKMTLGMIALALEESKETTPEH